MRTWTLTTTHNGTTDLQVMLWPYQRQAYRFVIDWFLTDERLERVELVDDRGWADTLTLCR